VTDAIDTPLDDDAFDDQLPFHLQIKAAVYFTPVQIARSAARLLAPRPGMVVLDVGAGAGKFCITAASTVPDATFVGIEWRGELVALANRLAEKAGLSNVSFAHGDALDLDWSPYDGFYLYNPFAEQLFPPGCGLDRTTDFDPHNYILYVTAVRERLASVRAGTRVVTYHGFGAPLPENYEWVSGDPTGRLELWIKTT
jgi:SAM-dependent methyltransferase